MMIHQTQPPFLLDQWTPNWITLLAMVLLIALLLMGLTPIIHYWSYQGMRTLYQAQQSKHLDTFNQAETPHFIFHFGDLNPESLALIQNESEHIFSGVNQFFNYSPSRKIPVVIYPTSQSLNSSFGWEGDRSPMGVYWMGYIKILSPDVWIKGDSADQARVFQTIGPMAHEYTHYVVDCQTNGNYPRWFSEGLAQYVEQSLSYYTIKPPEAQWQPLYDFSQLEKTFDSDVNQTFAYWQSLQAVTYLIDQYGQDIIPQILDQLAKGRSFQTVLKSLTGLSYDTLTQALLNNPSYETSLIPI